MSGCRMNAIMQEKISIAGARMTVRIIIMKLCCALFTSVVERVTRLAVENLSTLEKEKLCIFLNSA